MNRAHDCIPRRFLWPLVPFAILLALVIGPWSPCARSQSATAAAVAPAPDNYAPAREKAQGVAREILTRGVPGLAITVAVDGKIVYSEGFGYADLEERVPVWPTTKFRIGSVSKPLTATALVQLVEQGKLDLDASVQKYVPSFPEKGAKVTPRMVAGHLGGIRHYKDDEFLIQKHYGNVVDGLKIFQDDTLVAPPGTKFSYSSYGYNLLSAVIEGASREEFLSYMREHVFFPLGLRDIVADENSKIVARRTRFYSRDANGSIENGPYVDNSYKWAGGGFLSTTEDLVRFGSALLQPGFLKAESLALLFTSQKTKAGEETGYGMGWSVGKAQRNARIYSHGGGSIGGTSMLIIYPDAKVVVAVLTNLTDAPLKREDAERIAEPFLK